MPLTRFFFVQKHERIKIKIIVPSSTQGNILMKLSVFVGVGVGYGVGVGIATNSHIVELVLQYPDWQELLVLQGNPLHKKLFM